MTPQPAPPPLELRIGLPPSDVAEALANLQAACERWTPIPAQPSSFRAVLTGGDSPAAAACNGLPDVSAYLWLGLILGVAASGFGWASLWAGWRVLRGLAGALCCVVLGRRFTARELP